MSAKYTRITVTPDIGEALQVGAKAPFVVNLSQSISGVTIEELTKVSSEVKKDALSASNSAKAAKVSETNAKGSADSAKDQADLAKDQVGLATEQVEEAKNQVDLAKEQVGLATEQVEEAKNQVDLAKEQVGLATEQVVEAKNQVDLAKEQVVLATEQANVAANQALEATTQASLAKASSEEATTQAALATTKADEAKASAESSSTSAMESKNSATEADNSAKLAEQNSQDAKVSADAAKVSETNAKGSADSAEASLNELKSHTYDKTTVDSRLSEKVNKAGDTMSGPLETTTKVLTKSANGQQSLGLVSSNSGSANIEKVQDGKSYLIRVPQKTGTMLLEGDYGIGDRNPIGDQHLDDLRIPQIMQQPMTNKALLSKGYPFNSAGVLEIKQTVNGLGDGCLQIYTDYIGNRQAIRSWTGSTFKWEPWNVYAIGNYGLGATADDGFVSTDTPPNSDDVTSAGFYGGGGAGSTNYFEPYKPMIVATRQGGDGTGAVLQIQSGGVVQNPTLGYRIRAGGKSWSDWSKVAALDNPETQMFRGQVTSYSGIYCSEDDTFKDYFGLKRPQKGDPYGFYLAYGGSGYSINFPERTGGTILVQSGNQSTIRATNDYAGLTLARSNGYYSLLETNPSEKEGADGVFCNLVSRAPGGSNRGVISFSENVSGTVLVNKTPNTVKKQSINRNGFYQCQDIEPYDVMFMGIACTHVSNEQYVFSLWGRGNRFLFSTKEAGKWFGTWEVWTTANARADTNGFIKKASPIIDINPDGTFTTNDESEGATVTRVAQGEYLIEGVLGFNSDAGWGGADGGIEIPLDVNKQPLIWVDYKVMEDGSILIKTYHRTHPSAPKFARNDIAGYSDGDPIDIPNGRFISVRVQMPEQSIYNVRMRELEESSTLYEKYHKPIEEAWENKPEYIKDAMDKFLNI
ncbi:hypothetical protein [Proteus phage RP7]|nr:hypothetical protein [Proteus phage RP7]